MNEHAAERWRCEDCGWVWPLSALPPSEEAECDNCGGELVVGSVAL